MDILDGLKAIAALAFVLGILLGFAWLLRKYGSSIGLKIGQTVSDLQVVEWRALDMRRKLAVVRWDGREHLLVLGPTGDLLVANRAAPAPATPAPPAANDESGQ
jgi:flagellar protein FliO/FliZ